jgi:spore germination protein GerM
MTLRQTFVAAGLSVLAAVVLAACGIPNMAKPVAFSPPTPSPAAASPSPRLTSTGAAAEIYLVGPAGKLVPVRRDNVVGDVSSQATEVLSQLTAGPDQQDLARGLSSAIPPGLTVMLVRLSGQLAVVDLKGTDPGPATDEARLATAQVVLTLTSIPPVSQVLLTRNGVPQAVLPDGELTQLPMTRDDVSALLQQ